jgi:hypothetical protein
MFMAVREQKSKSLKLPAVVVVSCRLVTNDDGWICEAEN